MALRRNILLFHQGGLGDFVVTWPIALVLGRIYPQSRVFYVTHGSKGRLAEQALGVESLNADTGWHGLHAIDATLPEPQVRLLNGAHSILSFGGDSAGVWAGNVKRLASEANVLAIDPNPPEGYTGHVSAYQLDQLRPWPAAHAAGEQIARSIHSRGLSAARHTPTGGVILHPGSGSPDKNWPLERYLELAERLRAAGETVRLLLGEVEIERWSSSDIARCERVATVARPADYVALLGELRSARAFIGNDSGPGHLAGILGVPTISLFGPTDPARWQPLGPHVQVIRQSPLDGLKTDVVFDAIRKSQ